MTETDVPLAQKLRSDLDELYWKYYSQLPKCEGLLLRPNSKSLVQYTRRKIRRAKLTLQCSTLKKSKPGRKRSSVRVGIKADRLAKSVSYNTMKNDITIMMLVFLCIG